MKLDDLRELADFVMKESRKAEQKCLAKKPRYEGVMRGIGSNVAAALEMLVAGGVLTGGIYMLATMGSSAPQPPAAYQKPPELSSRPAGAKPDSEKRAEKSAKETPVMPAEPDKKPAGPIARPVETKPNPVVETKPNPVVETKPNPVVETKPNPVVEKNPEPVFPDFDFIRKHLRDKVVSEFERENPLFLRLMEKIREDEKIVDMRDKSLDELRAFEKERTDFIESYFSSLEKEKRIKGWVKNFFDMIGGQNDAANCETAIYSNRQRYYVELLDGSLCEFSLSINIWENKSRVDFLYTRYLDLHHLREADDKIEGIPGMRVPDSGNKTNKKSVEKKINPIESRPYVEFVRVNFPKYSCRIPKSEADALARLQNKYDAFSSTENDEGDTYVDYLGFYSKHLEKIPDEVYKFSHLKTLNLDWNELQSADGLEKIASLKYLDVSHNRFRSLESFCAIPNLEVLDARGNPFDSKTLPEEKQKLVKKGVRVILSDDDYAQYLREKPKAFRK
ncbi:MAG: hypothetical protein QXM31_01650 [Candidatus Woesearchaeota archaeon]